MAVERDRGVPESAERVARNDATFREANERIRAAAEDFAVEAKVPFICECAAEECAAIVRLRLDEYERIRADGRLFVNAPGHEAAAGPHARVVARADTYVTVEKVGRAGRVADALDGSTHLLEGDG